MYLFPSTLAALANCIAVNFRLFSSSFPDPASAVAASDFPALIFHRDWKPWLPPISAAATTTTHPDTPVSREEQGGQIEDLHMYNILAAWTRSILTARQIISMINKIKMSAKIYVNSADDDILLHTTPRRWRRWYSLSRFQSLFTGLLNPIAKVDSWQLSLSQYDAFKKPHVHSLDLSFGNFSSLRRVCFYLASMARHRMYNQITCGWV